MSARDILHGPIDPITRELIDVDKIIAAERAAKKRDTIINTFLRREAKKTAR